MIKTQIQLPDDLYRRVKHFSAEREWSLAENFRRAVEQFCARYPAEHMKEGEWSLPTDQEIVAMSPREASEWLKANPQHPSGWGADFRRELREARDRDAEIEEEREKEKTRLQQSDESPAKK